MNGNILEKTSDLSVISSSLCEERTTANHISALLCSSLTATVANSLYFIFKDGLASFALDTSWYWSPNLFHNL